RGGSWCDPPSLCRPANRAKGSANFRADFVGFRVVMFSL
ncbi:MAG: SUMF1/EgtB/PvdO family nonheme iron enzyme, partial [Snowella sp.]